MKLSPSRKTSVYGVCARTPKSLFNSITLTVVTCTGTVSLTLSAEPIAKPRAKQSESNTPGPRIVLISQVAEKLNVNVYTLG